MWKKNGIAADGENESQFVASWDGFEFPDMDNGGSDSSGEEEGDFISLPWDEEEPEKEEESPEKEPEDEEKDEKSDESESDSGEGDEEEIDLDELFKQSEDSQDEIANALKAADDIDPNNVSADEINSLKEQLRLADENSRKLSERIEKMANEKSDLMVRNAELTAFWGDFSDDWVLILNKNLEKARGWDDKAKWKVVAVLKGFLEELTGEDYDLKKVNEKADMLSAMEDYNNKSKTDVPQKSENEEFGLSL